MIRNIKHRRLKRYFEKGDASGLPDQYLKKIRLVLAVLDSVVSVDGINVPGGRLHQLTGDRKGYWSLTISRNWRITFRFEDGDALDVHFEDYH